MSDLGLISRRILRRMFPTLLFNCLAAGGIYLTEATQITKTTYPTPYHVFFSFFFVDFNSRSLRLFPTQVLHCLAARYIPYLPEISKIKTHNIHLNISDHTEKQPVNTGLIKAS